MTWAELPFKLRLYITLLSVLGVSTTAWAILSLVRNPPKNSIGNDSWIPLAVLTVLVVITACFTLFLKSANAAVGIGDAYTMAIAMLYGPASCVLVTFFQSLIMSLFGQRERRYTYRIFFNTASTVCGAWLYSQVYHLVNNNNKQLQDIFISAAALVVTYFFVNSTLTSLAIAWSLGERVFRFWVKTCLPLVVDYSLSCLGATVLVALTSVNQFIPALKDVADFLPVVAAPVILVVWGWNKIREARYLQTQEHLLEQEKLYLQTVESLALAVDAKDQTTYGHIRRVKAYAMGLAKLCGISDNNELKGIETGSLLHDIGKLAVEDYILNKPGRLTEKEFERIKGHATAGDEILKQVCFPYPVAKYVRYHHERWDGMGYPDGLKGEEIPLGARILSIADAFDAIHFSRPYKLSVSTDEALEILHAQSGTFYDPRLVRIFTEHIHELEQTALKESENAPKLSFRKYSEEVDGVSQASQSTGVFRDIPAELVQLSELCSALPGYLNLNDILPIIARRLDALIPFTTCVFYLKNGDNRIVAKHASGRFSELLQGHSIEIGKGISGWVVAYRRPMLNTGPALDFQGITGDFGSLMDALVVPIVHAGDSWGAISLYAERPGSYGQYELNMVQTLASLLAPLISEAQKNGDAESQDIDPTTGIRRVSYLTTIGPQLISSAGESRTPISLIYIEIGNLGQIIRVFGSNLGNLIIKRVAECIKPELRETDILVRYGHQAFVAFLPGVRDDQALRCVDRLKQQIRTGPLTLGQGFTIDLQAGVSYYPKDGSTVLALLQSAQENMLSRSGEKYASGNNIIEFSRT